MIIVKLYELIRDYDGELYATLRMYHYFAHICHVPASKYESLPDVLSYFGFRPVQASRLKREVLDVLRGNGNYDLLPVCIDFLEQCDIVPSSYYISVKLSEFVFYRNIERVNRLYYDRFFNMLNEIGYDSEHLKQLKQHYDDFYLEGIRALAHYIQFYLRQLVDMQRESLLYKELVKIATGGGLSESDL